MNESYSIVIIFAEHPMMSNGNIQGQESQIKDSLFEFVKTQIPDADLNLIDEIVLSYVVAVLEDVSSDPVFDVEGIFFNSFQSLFKPKSILFLRFL